MKTKKYVMILAAAVLLAACGKDEPKNDPDPSKPFVGLESITITAPTVKDANRTIVDKAGEFSYADKADATVKMTFKNAEPKDSAIVIPLTSKITWPATSAPVALTGEPVLTPTVSGTDKITIKYGTLEFKDFLTVTNTAFKLTRSGKSADMPFFGFTKVEAVGDATNEVTYATEGGKNYQISTLTQKFKLTHSDETTKEVEAVVLKLKFDVTGVTPKLVRYEEVKEKFFTELTIDQIFEMPAVGYNYTVRRHYDIGAPSDTTFSYAFLPRINIDRTEVAFPGYRNNHNLVSEVEEMIGDSFVLLSNDNVTDNLKVGLYENKFEFWFKGQIRSHRSAKFSYVLPRELKYSEKNMEVIELGLPEVTVRITDIYYSVSEVYDRGECYYTVLVLYGETEFARSDYVGFIFMN